MGKIDKAHLFNAISAMELKSMQEANKLDVESDRVSYYIKLGELQTLTRIRNFIAEYPVELEEEKNESISSL